MTAHLDIQTVYAKHLLLHFGHEGLAMFYKLPHFETVEVGTAILVMSDTCDEDQAAVLVKALELFANERGVTVMFKGYHYAPSPMLMVA